MVTTAEVGQLSGECNLWRDTLRSFRDQFTQHKTRLREVAGSQTHRDILLEIEHLDNQFHIQLINIHDLKQAIKNHDRKINAEKVSNNGSISDEILARHENLYDEYQSLESTLHVISDEFDKFIAYIK